EEQGELFDMASAELAIDRVKRVRDSVRKFFDGEVALQFVEVVAQRLHLPMLPFIKAPDEQMNSCVILRKPRGHLFTQENSRAFRDFQTTVNRVVVGDGDEIHPL